MKLQQAQSVLAQTATSSSIFCFTHQSQNAPGGSSLSSQIGTRSRRPRMPRSCRYAGMLVCWYVGMLVGEHEFCA